ncbi:MAG: hypothetical protein HUJ76_06225 [Parasporobacterium sp.]|nr:hypothetical protein [Parasporobacterium sp.]
MVFLGLILGLVGFIGGFIVPLLVPTIGAVAWVFVALCLAGIIFSAINMKKKKGPNVAGLVISIIGLLLSIIMAVACSTGKAVMNEAEKLANDPAVQAEVESALQQLGDELSAAVEEALPADAQGEVESVMEEIASAIEETTAAK